MKKFDVDTCTTGELLKRCRALRFSAQNVSLAVKFFILKTPHKEIADKFCINENYAKVANEIKIKRIVKSRSGKLTRAAFFNCKGYERLIIV